MPITTRAAGGIHRYLEAFPDGGRFKGRNFVFDRRVAIGPSDAVVVGRCVACSAEFDRLSGSRVCTVCRDLVLVCDSCAAALPEYHCTGHRDLAQVSLPAAAVEQNERGSQTQLFLTGTRSRQVYFTFLNRFDRDELAAQRAGLADMIRAIDNPKPACIKRTRNRRRSLVKQLARVDARVAEVVAGAAVLPRVPAAGAVRPCRTCYDELCNGLCWGMWKEQQGSTSGASVPPPDPVAVGDVVERGPCWNARSAAP